MPRLCPLQELRGGELVPPGGEALYRPAPMPAGQRDREGDRQADGALAAGIHTVADCSTRACPRAAAGPPRRPQISVVVNSQVFGAACRNHRRERPLGIYDCDRTIENRCRRSTAPPREGDWGGLRERVGASRSSKRTRATAANGNVAASRRREGGAPQDQAVYSCQLRLRIRSPRLDLGRLSALRRHPGLVAPTA